MPLFILFVVLIFGVDKIYIFCDSIGSKGSGNTVSGSFAILLNDKMPEFQVFDLIVLVLVGWLTLRGAMRGLIAQIASVAALVVSWGVAVKFSPLLAPMISDSAPTNKLLAMLILFVATSLAIWFFSGMIDKMISAIKLKKLDRFLGGTVGLVKGLLLCALITFFLVVFSETTRTFVLSSVCGKYLAVGIDKVAAIVPEDMSVIVRKNLEGFRSSLENSSLDDYFSDGFTFGKGQSSSTWDEDETPDENSYSSWDDARSSLQTIAESSARDVIKNAVEKTVENVKSDIVLSLKDIFGYNAEAQVPDSPLQNKVKKAPTEPPSTYSQESTPENPYSRDFFPDVPLKAPSHPIEPFRPGR